MAITVSGLEELRAHIQSRAAMLESAPEELLADIRAAMPQSRPRAGAVGVIQIRGAISQHSSGDLFAMLFGGTSTESVSATLKEFLRDDSIASIVLDIDSPGGSTAGVTELATEIRAARSKKPIVALANSLGASAAYWLGSAATEFYASPSALVGSIGVYAMHMDMSAAAEREGVKPTFISAGEFKTEGNEFEPLSDDARTHIQGIIDDTYGQFVHDVALGRGVSEATVRNGYGKGRVVTARQAKTLGMIDGIYSLEQSIARSVSVPSRNQPQEQAAELIAPEPNANEEGQRLLARLRWEEQKALAGTIQGGR